MWICHWEAGWVNSGRQLESMSCMLILRTFEFLFAWFCFNIHCEILHFVLLVGIRYKSCVDQVLNIYVPCEWFLIYILCGWVPVWDMRFWVNQEIYILWGWIPVWYMRLCVNGEIYIMCGWAHVWDMRLCVNQEIYILCEWVPVWDMRFCVTQEITSYVDEILCESRNYILCGWVIVWDMKNAMCDMRNTYYKYGTTTKWYLHHVWMNSYVGHSSWKLDPTSTYYTLFFWVWKCNIMFLMLYYF